jgi:uncharacterized membrane protein
MDIPVVYPLIGLCGTGLGIIGAALIINGGFKAAIMVVLLGLSKPAFTYNQVRRDFTAKIVFGLEFLIAADILATLLSPSQKDLTLQWLS